jgi:hypothetical protein
MESLLKIYWLLLLLLLGPEAVAHSLPAKEVQTVETTWIPVAGGEVKEVAEMWESVEVPPGAKGAIPLFRRDVTPMSGSNLVPYQSPPPPGPVAQPPAQRINHPKSLNKKRKIMRKSGDAYNFFFLSWAAGSQ